VTLKHTCTSGAWYTSTPAYHQGEVEGSLGTRASEKEGISPKSASLVAKLLKHLTAAHKVESHSKIIV